jgi:hypothetical protein
MEVLCGSDLLLPVMVLKLVQMASQGLSGADADTRGWRRNGRGRAIDAGDDFWSKVSSHYALNNPTPMKAENAPRRVLFEISVILAVVALLVVAVALLLPGGAFP